MLSAKLL